MEPLPESVHNITLPGSSFYRQVDHLVKTKEIDILFRVYPLDDDLEVSLSKQIVFVPDIQHEIFPEFFKTADLRARRLAFGKALSKAGGIITLSEHAKKTINDSPWALDPDIFVVNPALQEEHRNFQESDLSDQERQLLPKGGFFYFPANLWPHKNHRRTFQAFREFLESTKADMAIILTGFPEGWEDLRASVADLPIRHLGYVSPQMVQVLMQRAEAMLFFSLFEGFGIPLLEAFRAETPVICSDTTSLPEVSGDAALRCDPTDTHAMASLMIRIHEDENLRKCLVEKGKKRGSYFTWHRAAEAMHRSFEIVYEKIALENRLKTSKPRVEWGSERPLVSIVTPSYNQGIFLKRTIDSVLNQDYPNTEYIVVDGGSEDGSLDILKSYKDAFEWISEPDRGQTHAINKGFARARGMIRCYLNSDDILYPGAISTVVEQFHENPEVDLLYGKADYIDEKDRKTGMYNTDEYSFERNLFDCCICQPASFWRKRIADIVGKFDEGLQYAMDYDYWLRIDRAGGRILHIPDILAASRRYEGTKTLSQRDEIFTEIFKICKTHANYVSINYFEGLWHHRLIEKRSLLSKMLRPIRRYYRRIGLFHYILFNRDYYRPKNLPMSLSLGISPYLQRRSPILYHLFYRLGRDLSRHKAKVKGVYQDNWISPKCCFRLNNSNGKYHLAGVPNQDMSMRVLLNGKQGDAYQLISNKYEQFEFEIGGENGTRLELRFSKWFEDPHKRKLSFLIYDTDLFMPYDL
ncbi:MAG: glycosyltransferase [Deltaproteobacteria bacterium]|nr:glycosyltransferase [Deltaproteobacteria bacterium]